MFETYTLNEQAFLSPTFVRNTCFESWCDLGSTSQPRLQPYDSSW